MKMVKIEKNGTDIIITLDDNRTIVFHGNDGMLVSYTGRTISNLPPVKRLENPTDREKALLDCLVHDGFNHAKITNEYYSYLRRFELFYDWLEKRNKDFFPSYLPKDCPKGFLKWIEENNKHLDRYSYEEFMIQKQLSVLTQEDRDFINLIKGHVSINQQYLDWFTNTTPENRIKIRQIFKTTVKSIVWNLASSTNQFITTFFTNEFYDYCTESCVKNPINYADSNRDMDYNINLIKKVAETQRENLLKVRQEKIKEIEKIENEDFVIVVPTLADHFTDEGQQQNNCVGYYYHNSIKQGKNLIYFIRKKSNPKKSYITNRYNIASKTTAESRRVNNSSNNDRKAWDLIKEIDNKIREILKQS